MATYKVVIMLNGKTVDKICGSMGEVVAFIYDITKNNEALNISIQNLAYKMVKPTAPDIACKGCSNLGYEEVSGMYGCTKSLGSVASVNINDCKRGALCMLYNMKSAFSK